LTLAEKRKGKRKRNVRTRVKGGGRPSSATALGKTGRRPEGEKHDLGRRGKWKDDLGRNSSGEKQARSGTLFKGSGSTRKGNDRRTFKLQKRSQKRNSGKGKSKRKQEKEAEYYGRAGFKGEKKKRMEVLPEGGASTGGEWHREWGPPEVWQEMAKERARGKQAKMKERKD